VLGGCALQVDERASGLVVTNPRRLERGQVHVAYADGSVCWERATWEYWGRLEGFGHSADESDPVVGAARILGALAPDDIHYLNGAGARFHANHPGSGGQAVPSATEKTGDTAGHLNGFTGNLAAKLEACGLRVQLVNSALGCEAIAVTNPAAPGWGTVHVGQDGLVRFCDSDAGALNDAGIASILDQVTSVLRGSRPKTDPGDRWTVVDGDRLRQLRRQRRLTQQQLARRAGVSRRTIGGLERRRRTRCQNRTAALLAVALEVHLASLCGETYSAGRPASSSVRGSDGRKPASAGNADSQPASSHQARPGIQPGGTS
jgi:DNA-binding XRE family transcriptional regulator